MTYFIKFYSLVAVAFAFNSAKCSNDALESNVKAIVIQNLTKFLNENPEIKLLHPLVREQLTDNPSPVSQLTYYAGKRVNGK